MARGRRRGPSLLIPMIVLILATMGVVYWATAVAEELERKQAVLAEQQIETYTVKVREDEARVRFEQATEHIGYRGAGSISNPDTIGMAMESIRSRSYAFYDVDPTAELGQRQTLTRGDSQSPGKEAVVDIIAWQDGLINSLLTANRNLMLSILHHRQLSDTGFGTSLQAIEEAERSRNRDIDAAIRGRGDNDSLFEALSKTDEAAQEIATSDEQMIELYRRLWSEETSQLPAIIESLRRVRREVAQLKVEVSHEAEEVERVIADTSPLRDSAGHYDGAIYYVDMQRRWAYINLGQRDNVRPGMTFEVERLRRTDRPLVLGMVTVREVLSANTSWCEISLLRDESVPMMRGDKVIARNFSRDVRPRFALVGQFGGAYSRYSRAETEQMLRQAGYQVDPELTRHTNIVVLGVGFRRDSQYRRLIERGDLAPFEETYQYWRPADVYYLLGFDD